MSSSSGEPLGGQNTQKRYRITHVSFSVEEPFQIELCQILFWTHTSGGGGVQGTEAPSQKPKQETSKVKFNAAQKTRPQESPLLLRAGPILGRERERRVRQLWLTCVRIKPLPGRLSTGKPGSLPGAGPRHPPSAAA